MRHAQRGITLTSFLCILVVAGAVLYVGMKIFPMYQEFYAVKSAMKGIAQDYTGKSLDQRAIQKSLFQRLDMNYVSSVKPDHVKFEREGSGWNMVVKYEVRKPIAGNLDVVGNFAHTQPVTSSSVQ